MMEDLKYAIEYFELAFDYLKEKYRALSLEAAFCGDKDIQKNVDELRSPMDEIESALLFLEV